MQSGQQPQALSSKNELDLGLALLHALRGNRMLDAIFILQEIPTGSPAVNAISNYRKFSCLHWAAEHTAPIEVVRLLIEKGADLSIKDSYNATPMKIAAEKENFTFMQTAASFKNTDPETDHLQFNLPLICAIKQKKFYVATQLIRGGAKANKFFNPYDGTALHYAAVNLGRPEDQALVSLLVVEGKGDLSLRISRGCTPAMLAASHNNPLFLETVAGLKKTDEKDMFGYSSALVYLVKAKEFVTALTLLKAGAKANIFDLDGSTALHWAAQHTETPRDLIHLLLEKSDLDTVDEQGKNLFKAAIEAIHLKFIRMLLEKLNEDNKQSALFERFKNELIQSTLFDVKFTKPEEFFELASIFYLLGLDEKCLEYLEKISPHLYALPSSLTMARNIYSRTFNEEPSTADKDDMIVMINKIKTHRINIIINALVGGIIWKEAFNIFSKMTPADLIAAINAHKTMKKALEHEPIDPQLYLAVQLFHYLYQSIDTRCANNSAIKDLFTQLDNKQGQAHLLRLLKSSSTSLIPIIAYLVYENGESALADKILKLPAAKTEINASLQLKLLILVVEQGVDPFVIYTVATQYVNVSAIAKEDADKLKEYAKCSMIPLLFADTHLAATHKADLVNLDTSDQHKKYNNDNHMKVRKFLNEGSGLLTQSLFQQCEKGRKNPDNVSKLIEERKNKLQLKEWVQQKKAAI